MPRPMRHGTNEVSKDFFGSIKRLFLNLETYRIFLIIALILASVSAILAIISPNILSDLTDIITDGISPKVEKIETISQNISFAFNEANVSKTIEEITKEGLMTDEVKETIMAINNKDGKTFASLPDEILLRFLEPITIDGSLISQEDQLKFMRLASSVDSSDYESMLGLIDELPKSIYEVIKPSIDMAKIKSVVILLVVIYLVSALFSFVQSLMLATISNNFAKKLRSQLSYKINKLPLKYFDTHETGNVLSIVTNDVDMIGMQLNQSAATLVTATTLFIGSIIMMFITNYLMAFTAIVASIFGFFFMFMILGKSQKYFNQRQKELGKMNGYIEEMYSGANIVKTYNAYDDTVEAFDELNDRLYYCNRKSSFLAGLMQPIMGFVGNFGYVAVCVVGAILVMNNSISFGVIVAFMIYVRLFTNPLSQIAQSFANLQSTVAAGERVFEFLDEEEMLDEKDKEKYLDPKKIKGNIEFKNVKFGYNDDRIIINDFSALANSGKKIAIVGPTGAGKTTLVNLLMKFYELNDGNIYIDGISTKELTRKNIHDLFIMVLQDTWLFEGTVRDNIKYNKDSVTDEEIWDALKTVGVDHFVKTLPGGLDAKISDTESISQGQKQLLTIARGMIKNAPLLILDEATSNVDTRTEELVQKAMDKLMVGRTSFIIAHRLSTIKNADLILVMKDGNIVEMGNHDELIALNGFYSDLYNSQFKK